MCTRSYFNWSHQSYREFMTEVLKHLEPCHYARCHIVYNELDEFGEVIFIDRGTIMIGLEINKAKKFVIKLDNQCAIGAFGLTFNQRSRYIYKTVNEQAHGYYIRKEHWINMMSDYEEITSALKKNILMDYFMNIRVKMEFSRKLLISKFNKRKDHNSIVTNDLKFQKIRNFNLRDRNGNLIGQEDEEEQQIFSNFVNLNTAHELDDDDFDAQFANVQKNAMDT